MKCPCLSLVGFFALKSTMSDINTAILTFLWWIFAWNIFFHNFTSKQSVPLCLKYISHKQHIIGSCFYPAWISTFCLQCTVHLHVMLLRPWDLTIVLLFVFYLMHLSFIYSFFVAFTGVTQIFLSIPFYPFYWLLPIPVYLLRWTTIYIVNLL